MAVHTVGYSGVDLEHLGIRGAQIIRDLHSKGRNKASGDYIAAEDAQ